MLTLWDAPSSRLLRTLEGRSDGVIPAASSPDGSTLVSGSRDKTLKLWAAASGRRIRTLGLRPRGSVPLPKTTP
ncbi:MAG: WD40 repeat domain-containing protein [Bryobacteraceae bacterium]